MLPRPRLLEILAAMKQLKQLLLVATIHLSTEWQHWKRFF
jgi:hypothetical protein